MKEKLHDHIVQEIRANTTADIIFIVTAILLNLIILAINSSIASGNKSNYLIMLVFVVLVVIINITVEIGLIKGRKTKLKLINGLLEMYEDSGCSKYYDRSLLSNYKTRYTLFMVSVLATGIVAILVPFIA